MANVVAGLTGFSGKIAWDATKPDGQPRRMLDTSRAQEEFGFKAKTTLKEGLQTTIEWYLHSRSGSPPKATGTFVS